MTPENAAKFIERHWNFDGKPVGTSERIAALIRALDDVAKAAAEIDSNAMPCMDSAGYPDDSGLRDYGYAVLHIVIEKIEPALAKLKEISNA